MLMFDVVSFKKFYNAVPVVNLVTPFPCLRADGESDELRRLTLLLCRLFASLLRRVEDDVRSRGSNSRRQQLVQAGACVKNVERSYSLLNVRASHLIYVFSVGSFFSRARRFGSDSEALTMSHPLMTSPPAQVTRQASEGASLMRPDRRLEESMPSTCTSGRTPREGATAASGLSMRDLTERFKRLMSLCVDFVIYTGNINMHFLKEVL